jgi:hypothetical protein
LVAGEAGWRKSTFSGNDACLEVKFESDRVLVRDSKDLRGPALAFPLERWQMFVQGIAQGDFIGSGER